MRESLQAVVSQVAQSAAAVGSLPDLLRIAGDACLQREGALGFAAAVREGEKLRVVHVAGTTPLPSGNEIPLETIRASVAEGAATIGGASLGIATTNPILAAPIRSGSRLAGLLLVFLTAGDPPAAGTISLSELTAIADTLSLAQLAIDARARLARRDRLATLGTICAAMTQEVRNLLMSLRTAVDTLELEIESIDSPAAQDTIEAMSEALEQGQRTVKQVSMYGGASAGQDLVQDIREAVEQCVERQRRDFPGSTIRFDNELPPLPCRVGEAGLAQILGNLIRNAHEAAGEAARITVRAEDVSLRAPRKTLTGVLEPGWYISLTVVDSGPGIGIEILPQIFDPFFTTRSEGGHSGLGLAIVHNIVTLAGGAIDVVSGPGTGTRIEVHVPVAGTPAA